jgi:recombinational DNA repair protein (RecF pathway)
MGMTCAWCKQELLKEEDYCYSEDGEIICVPCWSRYCDLINREQDLRESVGDYLF